jgi:hypothetical protein
MLSPVDLGYGQGPSSMQMEQQVYLAAYYRQQMANGNGSPDGSIGSASDMVMSGMGSVGSMNMGGGSNGSVDGM